MYDGMEEQHLRLSEATSLSSTLFSLVVSFKNGGVLKKYCNEMNFLMTTIQMI